MSQDAKRERTEAHASAMREALLMTESEFASDLVRSVHAVTIERKKVTALICFSPDGPGKGLEHSCVITLEDAYKARLELPDRDGKRWPAELDAAQSKTLSAYAQRAGRTLISLMAVTAVDTPAKGRGLENMDRFDIQRGLELWLQEATEATRELLRRARERSQHPEDPPDHHTAALAAAEQALSTAAAAIARLRN